MDKLKSAMQDVFSSQPSGPPTVVADGESVVTVREIRNVKGNAFSTTIETESDPRRRPSGNVGQAAPADYSAHDGSVICADTISDVTIVGNIDFTVKTSSSKIRAGDILPTYYKWSIIYLSFFSLSFTNQSNERKLSVRVNSVNPITALLSGTVDETPSSSQGPAVKIITEHKVELIVCLMADHSFILQHVHAKQIITDRQYQNMKHISQPEKTITNLIDQVICKGQETCSSFLEVLKQPDVLTTYPQLKHITKKWC
ncbi:uncharacterized protein LOC118328088 isoform X1 [Morone saxatilis]|uniref:uncharacterized protein LOC118328088 isoform X1 n=1 Tax=Morone saxatilis TaxID=34816 RepID=UPI0015E1E1D1|nr:uncharacterized protein LOC118328088 isoform X1 [Morone saxatilis]